MPNNNHENEKVYIAQTQLTKNSIQPLNKKSPRFIALEQFYREKSILARHFFKDLTQEKGRKIGTAAGYLAEDDTNQRMYMIKTTPATTLTKTFVTEYLTAGLYKRVLYNRAPDIELVQDTNQEQDLEHKHQEDAPAKKDTDTLYFRSKFLDPFTPIARMEQKAYKQKDFSELQDIHGFAKIIATCLWLGETDAHGYNLGVSEYNTQDANGNVKVERIAVKIDHGNSAYFMETEEAMRVRLFDIFSMGKDDNPYIVDGRPGTYTLIDCKISEFKTALEEIAKISDSEIDALIGSRAIKLKQYALASIHKESPLQTVIQKYLQNIEDFSKKIIQGLINHRKIIQNDLLKSLEIIEIIGQGPTQLYHTDTDKKMFIQKPIQELIDHALEISNNPEELKKLQKIVKHFHAKIMQSSNITSNHIAEFTRLAQSENPDDWETLDAVYGFELLFPARIQKNPGQTEVLYKFELLLDESGQEQCWKDRESSYFPYIPYIKQLQHLEQTHQAITVKIEALQNNKIIDYLAYKDSVTQKRIQLEREYMTWRLQYHPEKLTDISEKDKQLKKEILKQNHTLQYEYTNYQEQTRLISLKLQHDPKESIKILFYPTSDNNTKQTRILMQKVLDGNKTLYKKYYAQNKAEEKHRYLLTFMEENINQLSSLLKNPGLDESDKTRILSVLNTPSNDRENTIASAFRALPPDTIQAAVSIHITSILSKFSLFKKK